KQKGRLQGRELRIAHWNVSADRFDRHGKSLAIQVADRYRSTDQHRDAPPQTILSSSHATSSADMRLYTLSEQTFTSFLLSATIAPVPQRAQLLPQRGGQLQRWAHNGTDGIS